jgi:SAM-dependent methyltransferase
MRTFEELVAEAAAHEFSGWDFSALEGRIRREGMPWDYAARVHEKAKDAHTLLDLGTGGGEFLAAVRPRPPLTIATESFMPNVPVAGRRLLPLGAYVIATEGAADNAKQTADEETGRLPLRTGSVDLVIDRHTAFRPAEVARVLRPDGTFITQQVGSADEIELCEALGAVTPTLSPDVGQYASQLTRAGLEVIEARDAFPAKTYLDVGAILFNVLAIPWSYGGFSLQEHRGRLKEIHTLIEREGGFTVHEHRLFFVAVRH